MKATKKIWVAFLLALAAAELLLVGTPGRGMMRNGTTSEAPTGFVKALSVSSTKNGFRFPGRVHFNRLSRNSLDRSHRWAGERRLLRQS
jgi:hypothetical protein